MKRMLINATQHEELRVALVDGQVLYDLDIETLYSAQKKANIYKGKITRIEPSLEAVFVDYGSQRHGFLPFKEISKEYLTGSTNTGGDNQPSFKDMIEVGQEVLVQIDKEERGNKGAALTTYISLAGRFLVLMPNNPRAGGVSRRIQGDERRELRETLDELSAPDNMGVIVRTAGVGRSHEELQWDLDFLLQLWDAISDEYDKATPQRLIYQESNIIVRALRDYLRPDIAQILIDDPRVYQQAADFMNLVMPNNISKLKLYEDNIPLFTRYQIEGQIESAYQRNVQLPSGGELVIDYTEALVSIDINSSKATKGGDIEETAYQTNLEAADEIARQMRLRDLGGLLVIDFIDMAASRNRKDIEQRLFEATQIDRARVQIGRISRFGLLELSRQRLRPSIDEASHRVCPRCKGQGSIRGIQSMALSLLRLIEEEAMKERTSRITGELPVNIATYLLNEKRAAIRQIEQRNQVEVVLIPNANLHTPDYHIERLRDDEVSEDIANTPSYRLQTKAESAEENDSRQTKPVVIERAAVQGIVPQSPLPQRTPEPGSASAPAAPSSSKGLSSLFSKVVALFKADNEAGREALLDNRGEEETSSDDTSRGKEQRPTQRKARKYNERPQHRDKENRNHDNRRRRREPEDEQQEERHNRRQKEQSSSPANEGQQQRPENTVAKPAQSDSGKTHEENKNQRQQQNTGEQKNATRNKQRQQDVQDDVNPSIEELVNPPEEINGRRVHKGRPRDVYAVRGQGKADYQPEESSERENATQDADTDTDIDNDAVQDADNAIEKVVLESAPTPSQAEAPGMVAMLSGSATQEVNPTTAQQDSDSDAAQAAPIADATAAAAEKKLTDTEEKEPEQQTPEPDTAHRENAQPEDASSDVQETAPQNPLTKLPALGQSIWFDNIHRRMLVDGELTAMIEQDDLRGVTSNPAIFQKAMADGDAYNEGLSAWLATHDGDPREAFFALAIEDIQLACEQMRPVYDKTDGTDGMVSLEVSPDLAHDAQKTISEALTLAKRVNRENLMIKVPGTKAGLEAVTALTAAGLNVNVTLLFSVARYQEVLEAYIDGLKQRVADGKSIDMIRSVASFFVSRVDSKVDAALTEEHADLRGRAAVANAQLAYAYYLERISHDDWLALAQKGAAVQRLLWASTGTKNPNYSDVRYVDQLIGHDTVNTVPPATYQAFKDHGRAAETLTRHLDKAGAVIQAVRDAGVDIDAITDTLEQEGVAQFEAAFADLLQSLAAKIAALRAANADKSPTTETAEQAQSIGEAKEQPDSAQTSGTTTSEAEDE